MPITQERFIAVIATARKLVETQEQLAREIDSPETTLLIANANAAIEYIPPGPFKQTLVEMLGYINRAVQAARDSQRAITATELANIMQEVLHFSRTMQRNTTVANRQRIMREQAGIVPRQRYNNGISELPSVMQFGKPKYAEPRATSNADMENDPNYIAWSKQAGMLRELADIATGKKAGTLRSEDIAMLAKHWPEMLPKEGATVSAEQEVIQTTISTKQTTAATVAASDTNGTALLNDPDVISSSMPTLEQLNATADDPNADLL